MSETPMNTSRRTGSRPKVLMVLSTGLTREQFDEVRSAHPQADFIAADDDNVLDKVAGVNGLIGCPRKAFTDELLDRAGDSLQWVHASGAGVEHFIIPKFVESDVILTNGRVIQGPEVADHALALLLALTRNLHLVLKGESPRSMPRPIELRGKTVLVVGLGGIGLLIAERAAAFGSRITAVSAGSLPPMLAMLHRTYPPEELDDALPDADVVIVSAPLTSATSAMFGEHQFRLMKTTAYFVIVSRGGLVDTDALIHALQDGQIQAAGLDVTDPEPLPDDHPLRQFNNVIISPHTAGLSEHNRRRSFELIKINVDRFVNGVAPLNQVNKRLGY